MSITNKEEWITGTLPFFSTHCTIFNTKTKHCPEPGGLCEADEGQTFLNPEKNNLVMPIPYGPKYYTWFTRASRNNKVKKDVCIFIPEDYFRDICRQERDGTQGRSSNTSKDISRVFSLPNDKCSWEFYNAAPVSQSQIDIHRGTILFGTLCAGSTFVAENVHFCAGKAQSQTQNREDTLATKFDSLLKIMDSIKSTSNGTKFTVASVFNLPIDLEILRSRSSSFKHYYFSTPSPTQMSKPLDSHNHAAIIPRLFSVSATAESDIYNLYTFDDQCKTALNFHSLAIIPNFKSSVYMNSNFRKFRENQNLDLLEESDDDETFFDSDENKFVDLQKTLVLPFIYIDKFEKWAPLLP